jgi:hypothetical protein
MVPASKSALTRLCWLCVTEPYANAGEACPDSPHRASESREGILQFEGIRQPALPAHAQLCSALRRIFDATREIASARHQDFCGPVNFLAWEPSALHCSSNALKS